MPQNKSIKNRHHIKHNKSLKKHNKEKKHLRKNQREESSFEPCFFQKPS